MKRKCQSCGAYLNDTDETCSLLFGIILSSYSRKPAADSYYICNDTIFYCEDEREDNVFT